MHHWNKQLPNQLLQFVVFFFFFPKYLHAFHILLSCCRSSILTNCWWQDANVKYYRTLNRIRDCQLSHPTSSQPWRGTAMGADCSQRWAQLLLPTSLRTTFSPVFFCKVCFCFFVLKGAIVYCCKGFKTFMKVMEKIWWCSSQDFFMGAWKINMKLKVDFKFCIKWL